MWQPCIIKSTLNLHYLSRSLDDFVINISYSHNHHNVNVKHLSQSSSYHISCYISSGRNRSLTFCDGFILCTYKHLL